MRVVVQRVSSAECQVEGVITGQINEGLLVFLGVEDADQQEDMDWLAHKIINLRVFSDEEGKMNKSLKDISGKILLISQFTLYALTKKGNRPSFINAGSPDYAQKKYLQMADKLTDLLGTKTEMGKFGADMKIKAYNDGPVTIFMNTKDKDNF